MKLIIKILYLLIFCSLTAAAGHSADKDISGKAQEQRVLILSSYSLTFLPTTHKYEAISSIFQKRKNLTFDAEFLDAKKLKNSPLLKEQTGLILRKVAAKAQYDLILAADDYALEVVLNHHKTVFKNSPVLYSGVSKATNLQRAKTVKNCRGYSELLDLKANIKAARRLVPNAEKVILIVDDSQIGINDHAYIMERKHLFNGLPILTLSSAELSLNQLLHKLNQNSESALVFLIALNSIKQRIIVDNIRQVQAALLKHTKSPIFTFVNYLAGGVAGGKITDQTAEGALLANSALSYLDGSALGKLQIDSTLTSRFVYDQKVLDYFGIPLNKLPENAKLINRPENFIQIDFTQIFIIISIGLIFSITLLIRQRVLNSKMVIFNKQVTESEQKLNTVLENSNDIVFQVDKRFSRMFCSQSYLKKLAFDNGEHTPFDDFSSSQKQSVIKSLKNLDQKSPSFMHTIKVAVDGKTLYYEWLFSAQFNKENEITSYIGAGRDITKSKLMEIEAQELANNLAITFKATQSAPWTVEIDKANNTFLITNELWLKLFGFTPNDFNDKVVNDVINQLAHPDDRQGLKERFKKCASGEMTSFSIQWRGLHKSRGYLWMETNAKLMRDEKSARILGITKIINDEKRLQIEFDKQQRKMNKTLEYTNVATWEYFPEDQQIKCDKNFYSILSEKSPESKRQPISSCRKYFASKSYNELLDCLDYISSKSSSRHFDIIIPAAGSNGVPRWLNVKGYKRETADSIDKVILQGVFVDVTELETISQALSSKHEELRSVCSNVGVDIIRINTRKEAIEIMYKSTISLKGSINREQYINECIHPNDLLKAKQKIDEIVSGNAKTLTMDYRLRPNRNSNEYKWVRAKGYITEYMTNGKPAIIYLIQFSIDEQKREHIELISREKRLSHITENSSDIIVEINHEHLILYCNQLFCQLVEKSYEQLIGANLQGFIHPHDLDDAIARVESYFKAQKSQSASISVRVKTAKYGYRWYEWSATGIENKDGTDLTMIGIGRDITEHKEKERQLQFTINHDRLSGLYSSTYINHYLSNTTSKTAKMAGIFINVNNLRSINETYGQTVGDDFIVELSDKLYEIVPNDRDIIARVAGQQFFILHTLPQGKKKLEESFKKKLEELNGSIIICSDHQVEIQSAVGYTLYPFDTKNTEDLIPLSESAMITAKELETGQIQRFDKQLYKKRLYKSEIVKEINESDIQNEFEMFYQPIVNIEDNSITKIEALLRWNHPQRGQLHPGSFIRIAEESNQIIEITNTVFHQILDDLQNWPLELSVSFNLSVKTLQQRNSSSFFIKAIRQAKVAPQRICFEITENLALVNNKNVSENLANLRKNGIGIALDDFGMHYSLLSLLPKVEFDILKIDRFFTQSISDPTSHSIIKMISEIVEEKNKECIVEGVETEEQLNSIKTFGFKFIQGYYFHKPMSRQNITKLLS